MSQQAGRVRDGRDNGNRMEKGRSRMRREAKEKGRNSERIGRGEEDQYIDQIHISPYRSATALVLKLFSFFF